MSKREDPANIKILKAKIDFAAFGKAAKEMLRSAINGEFGDSLKTMGSYFSGHFDTPEDQLYRLVWVASTNAFVRILKNKFGDRFESVYGKSPEELFLAKDLAAELYQIEFSADASFLTEPHRHTQIEPLKAFFKTWLVNTLQISEEQAAISTAAFPRLFLNEVSQIDPALYNNLLAYFERPAYPALKKEALIEAYHAHIMAEYDRPAFSDLRVSLDDMYVEPNFLYYKPEKDKAEAALSKDDFYRPASHLPLRHFIMDWLKGKSALKTPKQNAPILLLLGQPGQGKSSFVYRTVYKLLSEDQDAVQRVFMIRLRDLSTAEEGALMRSPLEVVLDKISKHGFDDHRLNLSDFDQSLLILDGLDELYMNRGLSLEDIQTFLSNLKKAIKEQSEKFNNPVRVKCIVTSRHNYVRIHDFKAAEDLLVLSLAEMSLEQQQEWLGRYGAHSERLQEVDQYVKTKDYLQKLHEKINSLAKKESANNPELKNLRELLNQPILLQLIVESRADLNDHPSRVSVYDNIFKAVTERKYADGNKIPGLEKIKTEDYRRFLQVLALQMYHSKNLYIRRADFDREPLKTEIKRLCDKTGHATLNARDLAKDLLVGFYFRAIRKESDQDDLDRSENYAFEFMHNSLFEYLVAEYIWDYFKYDLTDKNSRTQQFIKPFETAFVDLFNLFSPRQLSREVVINIRALIELESNQKNELLHLFERLRQELFPKMLSNDFLTEYRFDQSNQEQGPTDLSLAVFYGMISIMRPLANRFIAYPGLYMDDTDYKDKLQQNLISGSFIPAAQLGRFASLVQLLGSREEILFDLRYQSLCKADLRGAYFRKADFRGANLHQAFLSRALFHQADLSLANLSKAFLNLADLSLADLSRANLHGAYLMGADLHGAYLCESNLSETDLISTDLRAADLNKADLNRADLNGANLYRSDFRGAKNLNLIKNLNKARYLDQADFTGTIFEGKIHKNPDGTFEIEGYESPQNDSSKNLE